jgi:hypothetical protein
MGETIAEYPTVSWYMPKTQASAMQFVLKQFVLKDNVKQEQEVYSIKYLLQKPQGTDQSVVGTPGIMSLTLPVATSMSPLTIGQEYHWELKLICSDPTDNSLNIDDMKGGIKRVEPNPTLAARLQQATPEERVTLYVQENLWYNAVATLVELGRDRPNDPNLAAIWDKLLTSQGL